MKTKTAVLLINLGTPDSPSVRDVRSYLSQFLNDPRVIDIPWLLRKMLVNLIIVPFRAPKSAKIYQRLWTDNGSPLLYYSSRQKELLQKQVAETHDVYLAMRYKNPSIPVVLEEIRKKNYKRIIILPLFPQYASASTGSALDEVMRVIRTWWVIPELKIISSITITLPLLKHVRIGGGNIIFQSMIMFCSRITACPNGRWTRCTMKDYVLIMIVKMR
jgi:ferrochelatase